MVSNQRTFLKSILNIYKLKNCKKGWTGYNCNPEISDKINNFKIELGIISSESNTNIGLLDSIILEAGSNVLNIDTSDTTPEQYAKDLGNVTFKLSTKASEIFTFTLNRFKKFADSINNNNATESTNDNVTGGRKKRKTQHKKSRKSRKSIKNCKNRKH